MNMIYMFKLIVFYDGVCLFCLFEMCYLMCLNIVGKLVFEDIIVVDFSLCYLMFDWYVLNNCIYVMCDDGSMIDGFDVIY